MWIFWLCSFSQFLNQFIFFNLINIEYFIFLPPCFIHSSIKILLSTNMSSKMKGIYKSFKYISQVFVKDRDMEIGHPTDVKHVAHIGLDSTSPSGSAPSWMNEFKTGEVSERRDSSSTAVTALTHWSTHSQDFDLSIGYQSASDMSMELKQPKIPKKSKKKKSSKKISLSSRTKSKATCNNPVVQIPNYQL